MRKILLALPLLTALSVAQAQTQTTRWVDNFYLNVTKTALPSVQDDSLTITVTAGSTASGSIALANAGNIAINFDVSTEIEPLFDGYQTSTQDLTVGWVKFYPTDEIDPDTQFTNWVDQTSPTTDIGFDFPFYFDGDKTYSSFSAGLNGALVLGGGTLPQNPYGSFEYYHSFFDNDVPDDSFFGDFLVSTDPVIAPFWSVLDISTNSVRYRKEADRLVVSWEGADHDVLNGTDELQFQTHLYDDGTISFFYKQLNETVVSNAAAGFQIDPPGDNPQTSPEDYYFDMPVIDDSYTVTCTPIWQPWVTPGPLAGSVGGANQQSITFDVDAANQTQGTYNYDVDIVWGDGTTNTVDLTIVVEASAPALFAPSSISFTGLAYSVTSTDVTVSNSGNDTVSYSIQNGSAKTAGYTVDRTYPFYPWEGATLLTNDLPSDVVFHNDLFDWEDEFSSDGYESIEVRPVSYKSDELTENEVGLIPSAQFEPAWDDILVDLNSEGFTPLLPIGFEFSYYGTYYTNLSIGINGAISLGNAQAMPKMERWENFDPRTGWLWQNRQYIWVWYDFTLDDETLDAYANRTTLTKFPRTETASYWINTTVYKAYCYTPASIRENPIPDQFIAPYWSDLIMNDDSRIYMTRHEDRTVVTWENMLDAYADNGGDSQTFQIVLYKNGTIRFQYAHCDGIDFTHEPILVDGSADAVDRWTWDLQYGVDMGLVNTADQIIDLEDYFSFSLTNVVVTTNGYLPMPTRPDLPSDIPNLETNEVVTYYQYVGVEGLAFSFTPALPEPMISLGSSAFGSLEPGETRVLMIVGDALNTPADVSTTSTFTFNYDNDGSRPMNAAFRTVDPFSLTGLGAKDTDLDGVSDAAERMAGTSETDANSSFKTNMDGTRTLSWPVPTGTYAAFDRVYTIEYTTSLGSEWKFLTSVTNVTSFTDTLNTDEQAVFYRVTVSVLNP